VFVAMHGRDGSAKVHRPIKQGQRRIPAAPPPAGESRYRRKS
jgi:hypothetical protein